MKTYPKQKIGSRAYIGESMVKILICDDDQTFAQSMFKRILSLPAYSSKSMKLSCLTDIAEMSANTIIDTAIDLMRRKHKKGEFYYWILYYAYLSPQQCENAGAILQLLETKGISISLRTYYVHRDEAIEVLSSILWGYTSQDCEKITNLLTPD